MVPAVKLFKLYKFKSKGWSWFIYCQFLTPFYLGPYHYEGIEKMLVQMGADGTEDNVSIKVCSDTNDLCCQNVMKKVPNEDWKSGKKQEWLAADFGDCKNLKFKVII